MGKRTDHMPILLTVLVKNAVEKGVSFYKGGENLYLAKNIPADCFTGPSLPKEKHELKKQKPNKSLTPEFAGSFELDLTSAKKIKKKSKHVKKRNQIDWKKDRKKIGRQKDRLNSF